MEKRKWERPEIEILEEVGELLARELKHANSFSMQLSYTCTFIDGNSNTFGRFQMQDEITPTLVVNVWDVSRPSDSMGSWAPTIPSHHDEKVIALAEKKFEYLYQEYIYSKECCKKCEVNKTNE